MKPAVLSTRLRHSVTARCLPLCCVKTAYKSLKFRKHFQYPLAAWRYATHPGYLDRLQERILFFPLVQKQTRKNLEEIENCKEEFIAKTEKCIQELVISSKNYVQKLEEIKRNLKVSLLGVQSTLAEFGDMWT